MSFWKRLFSSDYRAARGAEAVGDLREAARRYGSCGADADLLRVTRRRADDEVDLRTHVALRRQVCYLAAELEDDEPAYHRELADALVRLARVVEPKEARELHREAGQSYLAAGDPEEAGRVFEMSGLWDEATTAYIEAGDLEAVERTAARSKPPSPDGEDPVDLPSWITTLLELGDIDRAVDAVAEAERTLAPEAAAARSCLETRLPVPHRLVLSGPDGCVRLSSEDVAEIGREPGLTLPLGATSVSRRHLSLKRAGTSLSVASLSARAPVSLDGSPLLAPATLQGAAEIGLGDECALSLHPEGSTWHVRAHVRGAEGDLLVLGEAVELGGVRFEADGCWWRAGDRILLLGSEVRDFTVVG